MEFKDGVSVYTIDDKKAGSLSRVVIDPETNQVTHIVIQKGLLFKEDKVVPVDKVNYASTEKIGLACSIDELKLMSPLEVPQYMPLNEASGDRKDYDPMVGGVFGGSPSERSVIMEVKRTIPDELIALKEGARVVSSDDMHVGNIVHVFTDSETGKVSHFLITQGLLLQTRKSLPIEWVKMITDDEVYLVVASKQVDALPEVQG